ncbi:hypothetical protein CERSUDRAFT_81230 [Gelatoporia subvermispora B]|uniref:Thioredoxin domain-containing protein n=1 Tax=Ceriporiopsis subvermispora (strain B) TaxID=914234 RepID=M2R5Q8_CERS8|nr:hypothetical protein CERSUDRAFT_81230 [Gelatoporia subvermispora B]
MSSKVQLYVYDLSNGLAKQLSMPLTGKQIDGVWHTSVVVFGKETFYGQGICITPPGQSHHGRPLQIVDMGETAIDEETFEEYLSEMRQHYTAEKYHLLDFNCNSFTNDCVGFLTGQSIPAWIKDLPSDFLSTPFGAALRPTIDAMFRRPVPGAAPTPGTLQPPPEAAAAAAAASPNPALAASLLQAVANQAFSPSPSTSTPSPSIPTASQATATIASPIHICTNPATLQSLLRTHRIAVVYFTSATCGPCRMIAPAFEDLAHEKTHRYSGKIAFVKVDLGVGLGSQVAGQYGVRVTPTFLFFLDGQKQHEIKGVNAPELRSQTDMLLYQAYPPHPHTRISLPAVESLSMKPILFTQVPALDTVLSKLGSFLDASSSSDAQSTKQTLTSIVLPYLKSQFPSKDATNVPKKLKASPVLLNSWSEATRKAAATLPPAQLFPLVDMWRLAFLDEAVGTWCAGLSTTHPHTINPVQLFLRKANDILDLTDPDVKAAARNYLLTVLRMIANAYATPALARVLLSPSGERDALTRALVGALLHGDAAVRTAAASVAFNVAASLQQRRVDQVRGADGAGASMGAEEDGEWDVELVSAMLEALGNEAQSEEVVHRLTAAIAFMLRLSPVYDTQLAPLLEVLQARDTLKAKLVAGGCGEQGVQKKDIRKLVEEVAERLCP